MTVKATLPNQKGKYWYMHVEGESKRPKKESKKKKRPDPKDPKDDRKVEHMLKDFYKVWSNDLCFESEIVDQ